MSLCLSTFRKLILTWNLDMKIGLDESESLVFGVLLMELLIWCDGYDFTLVS